MQHSVFNLITSCELARAIIIIPIVLMVKLRHRSQTNCPKSQIICGDRLPIISQNNLHFAEKETDTQREQIWSWDLSSSQWLPTMPNKESCRPSGPCRWGLSLSYLSPCSLYYIPSSLIQQAPNVPFQVSLWYDWGEGWGKVLCIEGVGLKTMKLYLRAGLGEQARLNQVLVQKKQAAVRATRSVRWNSLLSYCHPWLLNPTLMTTLPRRADEVLPAPLPHPPPFLTVLYPSALARGADVCAGNVG